MIINLGQFAENGILAGAQQGRAVAVRLLEMVEEPARAQAIFLDFQAVQVATASFLREGPLEFRRIVRGRSSNLYPVIANASREIRDELRLLLEMRSDAILSCDLVAGQEPSRVELLGQLDDKQAVTFRALAAAGESDAVSLAAQHGASERVGATAWNNRLAALAAKGLVMESSTGRAKMFRLPVSL
jgi:hypothetical protein